MHDQTAESVEESLTIEWIHRHGIPKALLTDQGGTWTGKLSGSCVEVWNSKETVSPYHRQEMGR